MDQIAHEAYKAFEHVVGSAKEFRARPGQQTMARLVAQTLAKGTLGEPAPDQPAEPERSIAVIEAGTGVGKSLAAAVPAIVAALKRETRVIISTATVNLQEQLLHKDLPRFAELMEHPFTVALGKGRGRYVCKVKLERLAGGEEEAPDDLFGEADDTPDRGGEAAAGHASLSESTVTLYRELARELQSGEWDGERDTLEAADDQVQWGRIAADRASCTGKHCPHRADCTYFEARKKLAGANVIVVNHDLLLSSIGANLLPDPKDCLLVLDEAHELPAVASSQFSLSMDLTSLRWLEQLGKRVAKVGASIDYEETKDAVKLTGELKQALADLQAMVMGLYSSFINAQQKTVRLARGQVPDAMQEPLSFIRSAARGVARHLGTMATSLREKLQGGPDRDLAALYTALGALAPRVTEVAECADMLLRQEATPDAKWFTFSDDRGFVRITAHASPIVPGNLLSSTLWPAVRSAVLTSATLTSCGSFDFFLSEVGLAGDAAVTALKVPSPFNYPEQGSLVVVETEADPRKIQDYNTEVAMEMVHDFALVQRGALALFTSRAHLEQVWQACPPAIQEILLVQGSRSRASLLADHRARVDAGRPSIILGLQSFGQGVDLPGDYCETLFIAKLPFAPPSDPIGETREEWLRELGRNAFTELSVPATGVRLAQWVGRLIRSESDRGTVICYDKRLTATQYGRRILAGLPPFELRRRIAGIEEPMTTTSEEVRS